MARYNRVKPLDKLLDDMIIEFESGADREYGKDLDEMIWELSDYENEEPLPEASEFKEEVPVEEDLVEKKMRTPRGKVSIQTSK